MLDIFSDDARCNPFPVYDRLRATSPLLHEPASGVYLLFDYASVKRVLDDAQTFASDLGSIGAHPAPKWLVFTDPPRHLKLRNIISQAFTPRMVAGLESQIREISHELLNRAMSRGEMDIAAEYSVPLPMRVIARMIGIPDADWTSYTRWSNAILQLSYTVRGMSPGGEQARTAGEEYSRVAQELSEYLPHLVEQRRVQPEDDLLTRLVTAECDGERLTPEELLAFVQLLIVGGQETTTNLINNALLCLFEHRDQFKLLQRHPELLPSAIEEVLRYRSPFQVVFRGTRHEVELHGQQIPAGKLLFLMLGSANRDPQQFSHPQQFDITREPNPHLAFGHGPHFCLGAALSRLETRIALTDLLERLPNLRVATSEPWQPRPALHVHGPMRLPVRFDACSGSTALAARN
ncbi:MAG TPA: cytochrome P450 [Planctomycetaceae bacterium]|nr:cytochrome P450 [Planctomycetaceae bacterium]